MSLPEVLLFVLPLETVHVVITNANEGTSPQFQELRSTQGALRGALCQNGNITKRIKIFKGKH